MEWRARAEELLRESDRLTNAVERFRTDGGEPYVEAVLQQVQQHVAALNAFYDEIGASIRQSSAVLLSR
jgi:uncharacterized protein YukE